MSRVSSGVLPNNSNPELLAFGACNLALVHTKLYFDCSLHILDVSPILKRLRTTAQLNYQGEEEQTEVALFELERHRSWKYFILRKKGPFIAKKMTFLQF
jgi:hypothetical protein